MRKVLGVGPGTRLGGLGFRCCSEQFNQIEFGTGVEEQVDIPVVLDGGVGDLDDQPYVTRPVLGFGVG